MALPLPTCVDFTREIEDCRISMLEILDHAKAGEKTSVARNLRIHLFGIQLSVWSVECFMSNVKRCMFAVECWLFGNALWCGVVWCGVVCARRSFEWEGCRNYSRCAAHRNKEQFALVASMPQTLDKRE